MKNASVHTARLLRRVSTPEERRVWQQLRGEKMGGLKFRRQHPFGKYVLDFYCVEKRVNIELDGGQHGNPENVTKDNERDLFLISKGVKTICVWNRSVRGNLPGVIVQIATELGIDK